MEAIREQTMNKDLGKESKIGIMCATARELAPYLSVMQIRETDECAMHSFHNGTIKDVCTTAVYSGCGKINASITAQLLIDRYDVDAIIFSGIAGGMRKEVKIFDTVVCTASSFHDTDNEIYTDFPVMKAPIFYADDGCRNIVIVILCTEQYGCSRICTVCKGGRIVFAVRAASFLRIFADACIGAGRVQEMED